MAVSVDGMIARENDDTSFVSETEWKNFHSMVQRVGNIVVGERTYKIMEKGREFEGLRAIKTLSGEGIPINCTLVFTPEQALLAAKVGAKIVSPFAGRIDDYLRTKNNISFDKAEYFPADGKNNLDDNGIVSGIDLVRQIVEIFKKHRIKGRP